MGTAYQAAESSHLSDGSCSLSPLVFTVRCMQALIYARVSEDPRGGGRSISEQEQECRAWAAREGWAIARVISETGSASRYARSTRKRRDWQQVVDAVTGQEMEILLTWEASRATRDLTVYSELRDLCARHGVLWGYSGTLYDLGKREDRFRTGLDALLSEDESARTSERIRRSVRARAAEGKPHGRIPYGYRREYDPSSGNLLRQVPDEVTGPVVREIYRLAAAGESMYGICRHLIREGIDTPRPTKYGWHGSTILRLVQNPANRGQRVHQGKVIGPAAWPALVDDALWDAANARLEDLTRPRRPDSTVKHLLSGIATCGVCGGQMYVVRPRGYMTYTCKRASCVARSKSNLDPYVLDRLVALLEERRRALTQLGPARPVEQTAAAELTALRARLEAFTVSAAEGEVSPAALARIEATLGPRISAAERQLRALRAPRTAALILSESDPRSFFELLDIADQRSTLRDLLTVTVMPSSRGYRQGIKPGSVLVIPTW